MTSTKTVFGSIALILVVGGLYCEMLFESDGKIVKRDQSVAVNSMKPNQRGFGTKPEIVMAPNVPPRLCFILHGQWWCIELNPLHWIVDATG